MKIFKFSCEVIRGHVGSYIPPGATELRFDIGTDGKWQSLRKMISLDDLGHNESLLEYLFRNAQEELKRELAKEEKAAHPNKEKGNYSR